MGFELSGRLMKMLPEQTGEGKNGTWRKAGIVIDLVDEKYPKKVCFTLWGDVIDQARNIGDGANVKVSFDVESREYMERWYTDLKAWRIEANTGSGVNNMPPPPSPFDMPPPPSQPILPSTPITDDDLPF